MRFVSEVNTIQRMQEEAEGGRMKEERGSGEQMLSRGPTRGDDKPQYRGGKRRAGAIEIKVSYRGEDRRQYRGGKSRRAEAIEIKGPYKGR